MVRICNRFQHRFFHKPLTPVTAFHYPRSPNATERAHAAARKLIRESGPDCVAEAERRGDEARKCGNLSALHHWRRTARFLAALVGKGGRA
jgi:hypothetical protein